MRVNFCTVRTRKITVPWLRLQASTARGKVGSLVRELRSHMTPGSAKKKKKGRRRKKRETITSHLLGWLIWKTENSIDENVEKLEHMHCWRDCKMQSFQKTVW